MKPEDAIILAIGDRAWGRGATLDEALKNLVEAGGSRRHYIAFVAAPGSRVDDMGDLCFSSGLRPKEICRTGMFKKARTAAKE